MKPTVNQNHRPRFLRRKALRTMKMMTILSLRKRGKEFILLNWMLLSLGRVIPSKRQRRGTLG